MKKIAIVYTDRFLEHDTGAHVESPKRVTAIVEELRDAPWKDCLDWVPPRPATLEQLTAIHEDYYIHYIRRECENIRHTTFLNPDTAISPESYEVALLAAGGVCEGIDRVLDNRADGFFALVRPPGHHAERADSLGFCIFNNIAIGASYARRERDIDRVFILDWDVHHGNGTQHAFDEDPSVFFCSFHQFPHYPGTGSKTETGNGRGLGYTLNLPMRSGCGNDDYMLLMEECVAPAVKKFKPQLLLISAGFDAHRSDQLGAIMLTEDGYCSMLETVLDAAGPQCRTGLVLEGGYNLNSLASSASAVTGVLAGENHCGYIPMVKSPGRFAVDLAASTRDRHPFFKS